MNSRPITVYPAEVRIGGSVWPKAKVRVNTAGDRIQVWVESTDYPRRPICIVDSSIVATLDDYDMYAQLSRRRGSWMIDNDVLLEVQAAAGCGCGSVLQQIPQWDKSSQQQHRRPTVTSPIG
jgi:hypothetical protein